MERRACKIQRAGRSNFIGGMEDIKSSAPLNELFNDKGWCVKSSLIETDLIEQARKFLETRRDQLQSSFEQWIGRSISSARDFAEHQSRIEEYENRQLPKDLRHFLTGEFDLETRLDHRIVALLSSENCREFLTEFLSSEKYLIHYPPMIRFKVADSPDSVLPPHQDAPYSDHLEDFITIWVPLCDIDSKVGGIIVYEGSHLDGALAHVTSGPWAHGLEAPKPTYPTRPTYMRAGDALLFPSHLIHESAPQKSHERIRYSIDFRALRSASDTTKSYFDPFTGKVTWAH